MAGVIYSALFKLISSFESVLEKDGTLWACVNPRSLNSANIPDNYPLRRMEASINSLDKAIVFTALDPLLLYWNVPFNEKDVDKTALPSHIGTYRYQRLPFGLFNTAFMLQRALNVIVSGL